MSYYEVPRVSEFEYFYSRWLKSSTLLEKLERGMCTPEKGEFSPLDILMSTIDPDAPGPNLLEPYSRSFLGESGWTRFHGGLSDEQKEKFIAVMSKEFLAWNSYIDAVAAFYPALASLATQAKEIYAALNTGVMRYVLDGERDDPFVFAKLADALVDFLIQVCKAEIRKG